MDKMKEAHEGREVLREVERRKKQEIFLTALSEWGTLRKALHLSKLAYDTYKTWHARDYKFAKLCEEARFAFAEYLEEIALERVLNPDKNRGSDVLLLGLLNANMPKKYRPQVQISDDASKELIHEWRKAAQEVAKHRSAVSSETELPEPVEQTLAEILGSRSSKKTEE
jgi:hypothetical protein